MMAATRQMLESMGVPAGQIKFEAFTSTHAAEPVGETSGPLPDGAAAEVTFAKAGKTATAAPQTVILDVAEACGVNIESECRSGICGTCKIRLKSGSVFMETRDALSRAEEESGLILACQAQPVGSVTVDA
jgi:ferredoxin